MRTRTTAGLWTATILLVGAPCRASEPPPASTHFELVKLRDGVYAATHAPGGTAIGNAGVVDLGGATLIFDTFHSIQAARDLKKAVAALTPSPIRYVVNSHHHNDHVWGNQVFAGEALLIGTEVTRRAILEGAPKDVAAAVQEGGKGLADLEKAIGSEPDALRRQELQLSASWTRAQLESLPELTITAPELTFESELVLHGTRRSARLVTLGGGSTGSDVFLHLPEDGVLFTGDLVMHGMHPILWEGAVENWLGTLRLMQELHVETVVPGHGPVGDASFIGTMIRYIESVERAAAEAVAKGESPDWAAPLAEPFGRWFYGGLFAANVQRAVQRPQSKP